MIWCVDRVMMLVVCESMQHLNKDALGVILRWLPPYMIPMLALMRVFRYAALEYMKEHRFGTVHAVYVLICAARSTYGDHVKILEWYMSKTKVINPALCGRIEPEDEPVLKLYFEHGFHQPMREYDIAHHLIMSFQLVVDNELNEWCQYRGSKWVVMVGDDYDRLADYVNKELSPPHTMVACDVVECLRGVTHLRDDHYWSDQGDELISFDNGISVIADRKRTFVTSHPTILSRVTCGNEYHRGVKDDSYLTMFNSPADAEYAIEVMKEWMTVDLRWRLPTFIAVDDEEKALDFFKRLFGDYYYQHEIRGVYEREDWHRVAVIRQAVAEELRELREFSGYEIYLSGNVPASVSKAHVFAMSFAHLTEPLTKRQCTALWTRILEAKSLRWARCRKVETVAPHHWTKIKTFLEHNVVVAHGSFLTMTDLVRRYIDAPMAGFPYIPNDMATLFSQVYNFDSSSGRLGLPDRALSKL